ncbi:UDP-N-Acetylglucosamine 2-epimerase [Actinopolyspora lacussalsi subsp. righensis]|uniref:UDP-N-acetylglucosamine 2-epimerase (non-hydrolyzing) n=1 Tax=Actinopolyspora righensis TaxID=995060 RepID=A0A1I7AKB1_9ACTN|nr:UDP-N-acetylglucosamine 2-epimerase (non-hydrolyzing) [Actinopolyspora righensis]SFT75419.1 UDP-N-Acetylglucosamine 2-epimerase [Actinopolyspora righensis]
MYGSEINSFAPRGQPEVWLVAGTRPEAVKLAPVARASFDNGRIRPVMVASGQHPEMVSQALRTFGLKSDVDITVRRGSGTQPELLSELITALDELAESRPPAAVLVQGDTTTTLAGALTAFWRRVPVVHLEAGLRSFDLRAPFPEELNRRMVTQVGDFHLAPTELAARNLRDSGIAPERILVSGNTVVDAVESATRGERVFENGELAGTVERAANGDDRLVLVTVHRRESWGEPMRRILTAVRELTTLHPDIRVVLPAHPNPRVGGMVRGMFEADPRVLVTDPLPYGELAHVLAASTLVLSDSGGIQEEAPAFGVPVLVLRDVTERTEAVDAGCALLVGSERARIVHHASRLLDDARARESMLAGGNPFGDGRGAERAEVVLAWLLGAAPELPEPFVAATSPASGVCSSVDSAGVPEHSG